MAWGRSVRGVFVARPRRRSSPQQAWTTTPNFPNHLRRHRREGAETRYLLWLCRCVDVGPGIGLVSPYQRPTTQVRVRLGLGRRHVDDSGTVAVPTRIAELSPDDVDETAGRTPRQIKKGSITKASDLS